tara:strand:- start:2744 stop:2917 length:174 start_codon:yes stop_codon:yes gene_type:complete
MMMLMVLAALATGAAIGYLVGRHRVAKGCGKDKGARQEVVSLDEKRKQVERRAKSLF